MNTDLQVSLGSLALSLSLLAGCQCPGEGSVTTSKTIASATRAHIEAPPAKSGERQPAPEMFAAQFRATIYEVEAAAGAGGSIDAKALEKQAGTAEGMLRALSKAGTPRILYHFDQPVNVLSQNLSVGTRDPIITGSSVTPQGGKLNSISYEQIGANLRLSGVASAGKFPEVTVAAELSLIAHGGVADKIASGMKTPSFRKVSVESQGELEFGEPRVMLVVDSASLDQDRPAVIYIICYRFNR